ncbi:MAG: type II toxin-antitoxin system HicB family antitoxin, partial [Thiohalomonadales bacterium]
DIICFDGTTVDELEKRFAESIDHYLVSCEKFGDNPQKPYSGKLMLRVDPQIHAAVAIASQIKGKSINQWASDVLEKAANG